MLGNLRKFSENARERSSDLQNSFGKSSEIFGKRLEIFGKSSKTPSSVCLYNKNNITRWQEDTCMNFVFSWQKTISYSFAALTREILSLPLEHKIHIFSPPCNIFYIWALYIHVGMCSPKGKGFSSLGYHFCPFWFQIVFLHSTLELGIFFRRNYFFIIIDKFINKSRSQRLPYQSEQGN